MEQTRQEAVKMLGELKQVKFAEPTARELHSSRPGRSRQGLGRVHRQEMKRYKLGIERKKRKLVKDIADIDKYLQSVEESTVLPVPIIALGKKPVLKKTKLPRYTQRRRFRQ